MCPPTVLDIIVMVHRVSLLLSNCEALIDSEIRPVLCSRTTRSVVQSAGDAAFIFKPSRLYGAVLCGHD